MSDFTTDAPGDYTSLKLYMEPAVVAIAERIEGDMLRLWEQFKGECPYTGGTQPTDSSQYEGSSLSYDDCVNRNPWEAS